ncbi:MAG: hypothetical protein LBP72_04990, partial [Dysgonamonadaceae bacterium]|nr:hypothetical protein [Dysgonamonadaceae bacterium]
CPIRLICVLVKGNVIFGLISWLIPYFFVPLRFLQRGRAGCGGVCVCVHNSVNFQTLEVKNIQ